MAVTATIMKHNGSFSVIESKVKSRAANSHLIKRCGKVKQLDCLSPIRDPDYQNAHVFPEACLHFHMPAFHHKIYSKLKLLVHPYANHE
jgi:hypothetical protein